MVQKISCMVVEDDEVDRLLAVAYLETYPFLDTLGAYDSPAAAGEAISRQPPDCLFLDIDMPGMSGLELRKQFMHVPVCIFITSFPDYAVESFELAALDFLVKPFTAGRFEKAVRRLREYMELRRKSDLLSHALGADTIFIKDGRDQVKLGLHEILYLEALDNYTCLVTTNRKYTVLSPIGGLLKENAFRNFLRIHRSFAVQKNFIRRIGAAEVEVDPGISLPVGRTYKDALNSVRD